MTKRRSTRGKRRGRSRGAGRQVAVGAAVAALVLAAAGGLWWVQHNQPPAAAPVAVGPDRSQGNPPADAPSGSGQAARAPDAAATPAAQIDLGAQGQPVFAPQAAAGANVLLITLDTTRADRLGCYGNQEIETPALDALARGGVLFTNAVAVSPTTLPSHTSILTGLYPAHHGVRANGVFRLDQQTTTLAEVLKQAGYRTAAVVSAYVLDRQFGLAQGFVRYYDDLSHEPQPLRRHYQERKADRATRKAIEYLRNLADQRFFLWVHYFDPHKEYQPPQPFADKYADNLYDGEIAFVDHELGRLLEVLHELQLDDRTLVVVVGDHGESLGQHGEPTHGYLVYQPTLHVPLIMRCGDKLGAGVRITQRVSQVDIVPTVLGLLGLEPPPDLDGRDLTRSGPGGRAVYFENLHGTMGFGWAPLAGAYAGPLKYIHGPKPELYDLEADPAEQHNLGSDRPAIAAGFKLLLGRVFGDDLAALAQVRPTVKPGAAELRKLEALGYVGVGSADEQRSGALPNPRDMMAAMTETEQAADPLLPPEQTIARLEAVVARYPDFFPAWRYLGDACRQAGELARAGEAYEKCLDLRPGLPDTQYMLALVRANQSRSAEAIEILTRLVQRYPDHLMGRYLLGTLLARQSRYEAAIEHLRRAFELDPRYKQCIANLVAAYRAAGHEQELLGVLRSYLSRNPDATRVRLELVKLLSQRKDFLGASAILAAGVRALPDDGELASQYALFLANCPDPKLRDPLKALKVVESYCQRVAEPNAGAMLTLTSLLAHTGRFDDALATARRGRELAIKQGDTKAQKSLERLISRLQRVRQKQPPGP